MRFAETGHHLEIDLANGNIEKIETNPKHLELFLGRVGHQRQGDVGPGAPRDPGLRPRQPVHHGLAGCSAARRPISCNRTVVSTISPQNNLLAYPMMGGFWSAELKYAGYDKVDPAQQVARAGLYLDPQRQGGDPRRRAPAGQGRRGDPGADQAGAEPAQRQRGGHRPGRREPGLHRLHRAEPLQRSRLGGGAVMGDKNVKAIAVRGTKDINLARRRRIHAAHEGGDRNTSTTATQTPSRTS